MWLGFACLGNFWQFDPFAHSRKKAPIIRIVFLSVADRVISDLQILIRWFFVNIHPEAFLCFPTLSQIIWNFWDFRKENRPRDKICCHCGPRKALSKAKPRRLRRYSSQSADLFDLWRILRSIKKIKHKSCNFTKFGRQNQWSNRHHLFLTGGLSELSIGQSMFSIGQGVFSRWAPEKTPSLIGSIPRPLQHFWATALACNRVNQRAVHPYKIRVKKSNLKRK